MADLFNALVNPLGSLFGGHGLLGGLFGHKDSPTVLPTPVMPTPDDASVLAAKRRKAAEIQARSGRQSTILTDNTGDKLGG